MFSLVHWFVGFLVSLVSLVLLGSQVSSELALFPAAGFFPTGFTAEVLTRPTGKGISMFCFSLTCCYTICVLSHSPPPPIPMYSRVYNLRYFTITLYHRIYLFAINKFGHWTDECPFIMSRTAQPGSSFGTFRSAGIKCADARLSG